MILPHTQKLSIEPTTITSIVDRLMELIRPLARSQLGIATAVFLGIINMLIKQEGLATQRATVPG